MNWGQVSAITQRRRIAYYQFVQKPFAAAREAAKKSAKSKPTMSGTPNLMDIVVLSDKKK